MSSRRGFVLILVLGLLGVLAALTLDLAQRSLTTRRLASRQIFLAKATLAARSGLEKALVGLRHSSWHFNPTPFEQELQYTDELKPSMPLAEDPSAATVLPLALTTEGQTHGVSVLLGPREAPDAAAILDIRRPCLDLNGGIESGVTEAGKSYAADFGLAYSASDPDHPFNDPILRLLDAWGDAQKYRHMVRSGKTYDWSLPIDHDRNLPGTYLGASLENRFDVFYPSAVCPGETPLGRLLVTERPPGGYLSLERPLELAAQYVKGWKDIDGNPAYPAGGWLRPGADPAIAPVTDVEVAAVVAEFKALATLNPSREVRWLFFREKLAPSPDGGVRNAFTLRDTRQYLNVRRYPLKHLPLDLNRAPRSVLAAAIHGIGNLWVWTYGRPPLDVITDEIMKYGPSFNPDHLSENGFAPVLFPGKTFIDAAGRRPLYSLTESLAIADALIAKRATGPLTDAASCGDFLKSLRVGYDHKVMESACQVKQGMHFNSTMGAYENSTNKAYDRGPWIAASNKAYLNGALFRDAYMGYARNSTLACLLNPHLNSTWLVWDEALPRSFENRINGIGAMYYRQCGNLYGLREFDKRWFFDKFDTHSTAGTATFNGGVFEVTSRGLSLDDRGRKSATRTLSVCLEAFHTLRVHAQRDLLAACSNPGTGVSTLGSAWITYPEAPQTAPAEWDGQLALRPQCDGFADSIWGTTPRARVPLFQYNPALQPTREMNGQEVWPQGPRSLPGTAGLETNVLRNSLVPAPGAAVPSLLPSSFAQVDSASDLLPGGGIRVSPFHNSYWLPDPPDPSTVSVAAEDNVRRREAVLVLRNSLVSQAEDNTYPNPGNTPITPTKVLQSYHDGAVGFWFKPFIHPAQLNMTRVSPPAISDLNDYRHSQGRTLFYMPLVIADTETESRCLLTTLVPPITPAITPFEAFLRKWFVGHFRLVWGHMSNEFDTNMLSFTGYSGQDNANQGMPGDQKFPSPILCWPYITGTTAANWPGFTQGNIGPLLMFSSMNGLTVGGLPGRLPSGAMTFNGDSSGSFGNFYLPWTAPDYSSNDAKNGHWWSPRPFPNEALFMEFEVGKYAFIDPSRFLRWHMLNANPPGGLVDWASWTAPADRLSPMAESSAYVAPTSHPLMLFDTRDTAHVDYHSVRKIFILGHPVCPNYLPANMATTNQGKGPRDRNGDHMGIIAQGRWNHIFIVWRNLYQLLSTNTNHMGGCVGVYVNGGLKKTVGLFEMAGIHFTTDYCEAYASAGSNVFAPWEDVGEVHSLYQVAPYTTLNRNKVLHWPHTGYHTLASLLDRCVPYPLIGDLYKSLRVAGSNWINTVPLPAHMTFSRGTHDFLAPDMYRSLPPRFYFGCQPHSMMNRSVTPQKPYYFPTGVAWGAFMDIQIFDEAKESTTTFGRISMPGGYFLPELPFYKNYSLLPNTANLLVYPLNLSAEKDAFVAGMAWSAYLPMFHPFWDDQYTLTPGIDPDDAQILSLTVHHSGTPVFTSTLNQDPAVAPTVRAYFAGAPLSVPNAADLALELDFDGPRATQSTPLIEGFDLWLLPRAPKITQFSIQ